METLFDNNFNILLHIILKNPINWSAACNCGYFRNSVYCYSFQMFISNRFEINYIRFGTRWHTRIGKNIKRVGISFFSLLFLWRKITLYILYYISIDLWMLCHHWKSRFIRLFKQLIFCWEELPDFNFLYIELLYVSLQQILFAVYYWVARMGWWIKNSNL